ncbi:hypothetical protein HT031_004611 [Scenedesmus sp. PABB004]|nr:hypothetical protein HT031_004611 [Scenedesmus sp. PABB004]
MSPEGSGDVSLRLLQLECVLAAKDRELSLLRQRAAAGDAAALIEQLSAENHELREELQSRGGGAGAGAGGEQPQPQPQRPGELLELNVSGSHMCLPAAALHQVPGSRLARMLRAGSDQQPPRDREGRLYLPFEPAPFRRVVSALQARAVFGAASPLARISLPAPRAQQQQLSADDECTGAAAAGSYLLELLAHLGLQELLAPAAAPGAPQRAARDAGSDEGLDAPGGGGPRS